MLIIDRFEGDFAVVEYEQGKTFNFQRCLLSAGAKEGDVVRIRVDMDAEGAAGRKKTITDLMNELFEP